MRDERAAEVEEGGGRALCGTGAEEEGVVEVVAFIAVDDGDGPKLAKIVEGRGSFTNPRDWLEADRSGPQGVFS